MLCCVPLGPRTPNSTNDASASARCGRQRSASLRCAAGRSAGYTLIELLIVVSLISILAGVVLPRFEPGIHDQLHSAAQILSADLAQARDLAVAGGSNYRVSFERSENRYALQHTGSNPLLNILPASPFGPSTTPTTRRVTDLDELPFMGPAVSLAGAERAGNSWQATNQIEFGPLGELRTPGDVRIWLVCGNADQRRYISVTVHAVTGLTEIGAYEAQGPVTGGT